MELSKKNGEGIRRSQNNECSDIIVPQVDITELLILIGFTGLYVWNISHYFFTLPMPSDPLQYLNSMDWGSTYGYWPWLDRIAFAIGLRVFSILTPVPYLAGPLYIGFINTLTLIVAAAWLYRQRGFISALFICIIFNTSVFHLGFATYIYPIQTEAFWALIAFITFFSNENSRIYKQRYIVAGFFACFAVFSKITGAFAAFYFFVYLVHGRKWRDLAAFFLGGICGAVFLLGVFVLLFNTESLQNVFHLFFKTTHTRATGLTNLVSFLDQMTSVKFFPVFISLFVLIGAYKHIFLRRLFCFAWANITTLYFIYTFTHRGGAAIPTYIYSAYIFTALGLAATIGVFFDSIEKPILKKCPDDKNPLILISMICLTLVCIGFIVGVKYPSVFDYNNSYLYYEAADIFTPNKISIPEFWRWTYTLGPILIVVLLMTMQTSRSKGCLVFFMLTVSLWSAVYNGGLAYGKANFDRKMAGFFYKAAPVLNEVPDQKFSIFVKEWNKQRHSHRLPWVYRAFFNEKYKKGTGYDAQYKNHRLIKGSIKYLKSENELKKLRGKQLLTDDPGLISRYYTSVDIVKTIPWEGINLYVVEPKNALKAGAELKPEDSELKSNATLNFKDLIDTKPVHWEEVNTRKRIVSGIRGEFFFERFKDDDTAFRIIPKRPDGKGDLLLQVSFIDKSDLDLASDKYIRLRAQVKLTGGTSGAELFIQDQSGKWDKRVKKLTQTEKWQTIQVEKRIRNQSTNFLAGIFWRPKDTESRVEIRNVRVYIW